MEKCRRLESEDTNDTVLDLIVVSDQDEEDEEDKVDDATVVEDEDEHCNKCKVVVKMKLNQFIKSYALKKSIQDVVMECNLLFGEAYAFANFHMLRILHDGKVIPRIDRNFYYHCIVAVQKKADTKDDVLLGADMFQSLQAFNMLRPDGGVEQKTNEMLYNRMTSKQLKTESKARGMKRYSNLKNAALITRLVQEFGETPLLTLTAEDLKPETSILSQVIADMSIAMATVACNHLWVNLDSRLTSYVKRNYPELKGKWKTIVDAVTKFPKASLDELFKRNSSQQLTIDAKKLASELRTLMPLPSKQHFASRAHLTLPLYFRILKATEEAKRTLDSTPSIKRTARIRMFNLLPMKSNYTISHVPISNMMFMTLIKSNGLEKFKDDGRKQDKYTMWSKYFNLNGVETQNRRFGFRINTDGCAVSIIMDKTTCVTCGIKSLKMLPKEEAECEHLLSCDVEKVGVDPGFTDIVTVSVLSTGQVKSYSSAQYYEKAYFNKSNRRTNKWNAETAEITQQLPTSKTADIETLKSHIAEFIRIQPFLLEHRSTKGYRNMRMLRYVKRKELIDEISNFIAPPGKHTLVGFGNWEAGNKSPISRRTCGPLEEVKRTLNRRTDVSLYLVDEHKTSIICHNCQCRLTNMKAITTRKRDGVSVPSLTTTKVHKVLHCKTSVSGPDCCKTTWNRDVNGAKNMLMKTMLALHGWKVPQAFQRSKQE